MLRVYGVLLFVGASYVSYELYERGFDFQTAVALVFGYIVLMVFLYGLITYIQLTTANRRLIPPGDNNGLVGDHCLIVDDAAICEQAGPIETRVKWHAIRKVSVGEDHAFIYIAPNRAFIAPKRAFADESDFNRFVRDCISRLPENTLNPQLEQTPR